MEERKGGEKMRRRIIELRKEKEERKCLICCEKPATTKLSIDRPKRGDNIIVFSVCDECLAQMQKDIESRE